MVSTMTFQNVIKNVRPTVLLNVFFFFYESYPFSETHKAYDISFFFFSPLVNVQANDQYIYNKCSVVFSGFLCEGNNLSTFPVK